MFAKISEFHLLGGRVQRRRKAPSTTPTAAQIAG
jgi:hypothetical protein